jgi:hypothetical protein
LNIRYDQERNARHRWDVRGGCSKTCSSVAPLATSATATTSWPDSRSARMTGLAQLSSARKFILQDLPGIGVRQQHHFFVGYAGRAVGHCRPDVLRCEVRVVFQTKATPWGRFTPHKGGVWGTLISGDRQVWLSFLLRRPRGMKSARGLENLPGAHPVLLA